MNSETNAGSCGTPVFCEKNTQEGSIIWILASTEQRLHFFVQKLGADIVPFSIGCDCKLHVGHAKNFALYMDAALACGQYDGLVLLGHTNMLEEIKMHLSPPVQSRIIAEIPRDLAGLSEKELESVIKDCALF